MRGKRLSGGIGGVVEMPAATACATAWRGGASSAPASGQAIRRRPAVWRESRREGWGVEDTSWSGWNGDSAQTSAAKASSVAAFSRILQILVVIVTYWKASHLDWIDA